MPALPCSKPKSSATASEPWWLNTDGPMSEGLVGCTLDGLVVGTDGDRFAALIQVADD